VWVVWLAAAAGGHAGATIVEPTRDDEVVETLPAVSGDRAEWRQWRRALASHPRAAQAAVTLAGRLQANLSIRRESPEG